MTVVLTGAAGTVGTTLREGLSARGFALRSSDIRPINRAALLPNETFVAADLVDADAVVALVAGADAVVHLGGVPDEAAFDALAGPNLRGTFNVFEAARRAGVGRVVSASSNRITGFAPTTARLTGTEAVAPDGLYGATKAFGEALATMYANKFAMDIVSVRIGSFEERPRNVRQLSTWLSPGDAVELFAAALAAPGGFGHLVVYGASANARSWWPPGAGAQRIGYRPRDDAEAFAPEIADADGADATFQGGPHTDRSYGGWADAAWPRPAPEDI